MECIDPPIEEKPSGKWHCPACPLLLEEEEEEEAEEADIIVQVDDTPMQIDPALLPSHESPSRQTSIASSSRHPPPTPSRPKRNGKGKSRDFDEPDLTIMVKSPKKSKSSKKSRRVTVDPEDDLPPPNKRPRLRYSSPSTQTVPPIRIRLPVTRYKGKERQEDEVERGLFDDILCPEDRDTSKTTVLNYEKVQFERARQAAEASSA